MAANIDVVLSESMVAVGELVSIDRKKMEDRIQVPHHQ